MLGFKEEGRRGFALGLDLLEGEVFPKLSVSRRAY